MDFCDNQSVLITGLSELCSVFKPREKEIETVRRLEMWSMIP